MAVSFIRPKQSDGLHAIQRYFKMSDQESKTEEIKFKKKSIKCRRKPLEQDSDEEKEDKEETEEDTISKLEEMKAIQKLRNRPKGINIIGLALGRKVAPDEEDISAVDPFKTKCGGMVNMNSLKSGKLKKVDDAYETGIGTQFSAETNKRDEDEEMMKYIEEQLSKKKGVREVKKEGKTETKVESQDGEKYCSPEEAALQAVPNHLRASSTQKSEEMLSYQMLSGIPEVDLGIDAKIRNIEATEEAKSRLLWNRHNKKEGPSQFVPNNITVNFMQQNKMHSDDSDHVAKKQTHFKKFRVQIEEDSKAPQKRKESEKATDDYHYEKFKKQFRRY